MLKVGVFGAGHLGNIHLNCLKNIENVKIIGFYDSNTDIRKEISDKHRIPFYDDADVLIKECDIVDIVTPTVSHHGVAMKALRENKHVFIEKPITATLAEAKEILAFSESKQLKVQIGHVERFNAAFLGAKPYIQNPMFIECHRLSEFNIRGTDVSVVLDLMIHDIDIVLHIVQSPIKHINASGVAIVSDTPDIANARIEFENGCTANLTASRISMKNMRRTRIFQKNAYITVDFLEKQTNIIQIRDYKPEDENDLFPLIIDLGKEKGKKRIFIESPPKENVNAIQMELSLFIQSILNNTACEVSVKDGYHALDIAYQIINKFIPTQPIV